MNNIIGSYDKDDVIFLLKDITDLIKEESNEIREAKIQNGVHYSTMLPIEYMPSKEYMEVFHKTLVKTSLKIAEVVAIVSEKILEGIGENIVLVSLARAGTPIGILIKKYIKYKYNLDLMHYSISIIRDIGIDENAIMWILKEHPGKKIQFIDGWTGKGVINDVLKKACINFNKIHGIAITPALAVLSDPAHCVNLFGSREDFLIPSACLNSTVSGLISRTVYRDDLIFKDDFHGAKFYKEWGKIDLSNFFIDSISKYFKNFLNIKIHKTKYDEITNLGIREIKRIQYEFGIKDINLIKPGVGEATRALLRRVPYKVLVKDISDPNLEHILILAKNKGVPVEIYKNMAYSCLSIIKFKGGSLE